MDKNQQNTDVESSNCFDVNAPTARICANAFLSAPSAKQKAVSKEKAVGTGSV
jgi:hypothetical protein